ncbi:MAG TPA: ribonuclease HI [Thermoanaerobaculia bacterium]
MNAPTSASAALPQVTIYTDGGADPNPGTGGWAAILIDDASGKTKELKGGEPRTTNNRMELTAAIRALETLKQPCRVRMLTDSQYLRKGITQWLPGWIARGWRRKEGELQNEDLWRRLSELIGRHEIRWDWVKGHAGDRWNERADELATLAIREQRGPAAAAPGPAAAGVPDAEVFLRISCAGRKGGWAALVRYAGEEKVLSGRCAGVSPNQVDLISAIEALRSLPRGISVAVHTASDYLRNGATSWLVSWKRRGWKTQEGNPVLNRDLWEKLEAEMALRRVDWPSVKGRELPEMETLAAAAREARGEEAK